MKELFIVGKLVFGQGRKVLITQTDNQHIPGSNIVNLTFLRSQRSIQRQLVEFTLFVDDDCGFVLPRINGLNPAADSLLQGFQTRLNFDGLGVALRLNQKDGEFLLLFHAAPPQSS